MIIIFIYKKITKLKSRTYLLICYLQSKNLTQIGTALIFFLFPSRLFGIFRCREFTKFKNYWTNVSLVTYKQSEVLQIITLSYKYAQFHIWFRDNLLQLVKMGDLKDPELSALNVGELDLYVDSMEPSRIDYIGNQG